MVLLWRGALNQDRASGEIRPTSVSGFGYLLVPYDLPPLSLW